MTTYVFPGQGSQILGMGDTLFNEFPDMVKKANEILGYSIETLCLKDPQAQLNKTEYTQPALYVVNALAYLKNKRDGNHLPSYLAGHSLGEYNALFAAEVFDFETGLKLVQKRGNLMSQATGGGMAAIIGLKSEVVQAILQTNNLQNISIANYNSYTQIVISGPKEEVNAAQPFFTQAGAMRVIPLKVSGAFHSPYMKDACNEFANFMQDFTFSPPSIPVIANLNASPYQFENISALLAKQITQPVMWVQTIAFLLSKGETNFIEMGPGKVLSGLINRIQKGQ